MNKELNIGDYVRDEKGNIDKLIDIRETTEYAPISAGAVSFHYTEKVFEKDRIKNQIIKNSPNIIGLIEVGDYLNGFRVNKIEKDTDNIGTIIKIGKSTFNVLPNEEIYTPSNDNNNGYEKIEKLKSIVTKEQFESMEYKIGE